MPVTWARKSWSPHSPLPATPGVAAAQQSAGGTLPPHGLSTAVSRVTAVGPLAAGLGAPDCAAFTAARSLDHRDHMASVRQLGIDWRSGSRALGGRAALVAEGDK
ncbi:hypothetical protein OAS39_13335 [Pirellulales bacterium]|nr:hypothetical protein [Pirellulales bacterium]